jgi:polyphosphate kinase
MFRFRRNREMFVMQERLIQQEEDKYINHRFTKYLVSKLTPLKGNALDSFMVTARPSYELLVTMNDLEFGYYIQQLYRIYANKPLQDPLPPIKKEMD